jgi:DNA-binding SARP family transcriptional activator
VRLRELLDAAGHDERLLRVTPESVTLAPSVTCDWLEFLDRTRNGELVGALSLVRGRPLEDAPLRRYGWAETLRHEMAALVIDTAHYVAEACLREQSPRNARKAALRGLAAAPESELLYRDLLTALAALGDLPAARRHADTLLGYADREGLPLQPETAALLRGVAQAASRS